METKKKESSPWNRSQLAMLWSCARRLPGGEETLRDMVSAIHQEDGTGKKLVGDQKVSTRFLTKDQFARLLNRVKGKTEWPKRRRGTHGNEVWLISDKEKQYIRFMTRALGWSKAAVDEFTKKQIGRLVPQTHKHANALIEPLERLMTSRGFTCVEMKGGKWWNIQ